MTATLEFTILGSGSSGGVPRADGEWGACDPANPKNLRSRCSLLVRRKGDGPVNETTVIVDTSPDLRIQTAMAGAKRMDAVLLTHDHADQMHGLDDVRAFFLRQRARLPVWMDAHTTESAFRRFGYVFEGQGGYPAICDARAIPAHGETWRVDGPSGAIPIVTFDQDHGEIRSVGYRFGGVAYSSDVVGLDDAAFEALADLDVWIVDALRYRPHPTHAHLERTLEWIARARPRRAILTNLHIDLDYETLRRELPAGCEPAYDGMRFEHELGAEFL
ncbi:MBL fold metallo-hydrolase [Phenylobacterium sp. J367]|uniref:MBL fold metallo-hydrolase n=1 Tax=Phenylobacterium sp. J367 TaxID=2898435 RepID=UPI002150897E|nr:MBL fold metallo-hydrolase [Phenylobacterium sp. J367]MCR5880415.1 MBL fold metallo-hydrolase [Phenylobacterium sp. J367]